MKSKKKIPSDMFAFMRELIDEVLGELYLNKKYPREVMPQLDLEDIKEDYGYKKVILPLSKMKPVQIERVEQEFKEAIEKIKKGTAKPIILDKFGRIVNGHHRYDAYKSLGIKEATSIIVDATLEELINTYDYLTEESLRNWFEEKWVRIDTQGNITGPCGTMKNKKRPSRCLPLAKARSLSKAERAATARKKKAGKGQFVPNTAKAKVTSEEALKILESDYTPTNKKLWNKAIAAAKRKFEKYPSAYANAWASKWYKGKGGNWKKK